MEGGVGKEVLLSACCLVALLGCHSAGTPGTPAQEQAAKHTISRYDQYFAATALAADRLVAVGQNGKIVLSRDRGQSWSLQSAGTAQSLFGVSFSTAQEGWVIGAGGSIFHTTDGGTTWSAQKSGTEHNLFGIALLNAQQGWVVGAAGVMLKTEDGGRHWQDRSLGQDVNLNALYFLDDRTGWVVGEYGAVLKTLDGGQTWEQVAGQIPDAGGEELSWEELMAADDIGAGGVSTVTLGGLGEEDILFGVYFADQERGWAPSTGGRIFLSANGGRHWEVQQTGYEAPLFAVGSACPTCPLYACGGRGLVLQSADGGHTWSKVSLARPVYSYLRDLVFPGQGEPFFVGTQGTLVGAGV